ncbi:SDR family oxidoreductase [Bacillus infantis]|uniref:SDR family oxidoreductase n=1 Tax=Bacillus infantis TaxID=324767 RepID=UPI002ED18334
MNCQKHVVAAGMSGYNLSKSMIERGGQMEERHYFFTGFPGFICSRLIREVLNKEPGNVHISVLSLREMEAAAKAEIRQICEETGASSGCFSIITGDITRAGLDITHQDLAYLRENITHLFHLAAIYDLAVPKDIAYKVNVEGTRQVTEFAGTLKKLERYVYFSTAYVAGKRDGLLKEDELLEPPGFKNHYEETKYLAEVIVENAKAELPVTILRPGIVKGHSVTGETIKFDGPYFILNFMDRLSRLPFLPMLGKGEAYINLVPVDYVIEAAVFLGTSAVGRNKTYHLTDPNPYKVSDLYELLMVELCGKRPAGSFPLSAAKGALRIKKLRNYLGVEQEALDYFTWQGRFDCSIAQTDLEGSGICCPDLKEGIPSMVSFFRQHKSDPRFQVHNSYS